MLFKALKTKVSVWKLIDVPCMANMFSFRCFSSILVYLFLFLSFFFGIFFFNVECRCGFFPVNSVLRRIGSLVIRCFAAARSQKQCRERHLESLYITLMVYHDWTIAFI